MRKKDGRQKFCRYFFLQKSFGRQKIKHNKNRKKYLEKETLLMEKLSVEELEELREKELGQ